MADRAVVVKRVNDRHVRERCPDLTQHVDSDVESVLDVDDVGLMRKQKFPEVDGEHLLFAL